MTNLFINPLDLLLTPPMDLNSSLPGVTSISPFPMRLKTSNGIGLFATTRNDDVSGRLIRTHAGIDLLAPVGTKVFASASGEIIGGIDTSVLILHNSGFKFLTYYQHMQNKVNIPADSNGKKIVSQGQIIAEVGSGQDHLHFELRYPFDNATPDRGNSLPVDPTFALYYWEIKLFRLGHTYSHIIDNVQIASFEEVVRGRQLRFIMCNFAGIKGDFFLPIQTGLPEDDSLAETIRSAFFAGKSVRVTWRDSQFFSEIQAARDKLSIIAEIKVYQ